MIRILLATLLSFLAVPARAPVSDDCFPDGKATYQTCAKPITGCLCWLSTYTLIITPGYNCLPCEWNFSGQFTCDGVHMTTYAHGDTLVCGTSATWGWRCPCTNSYYYPVEVECGDCPH